MVVESAAAAALPGVHRIQVGADGAGNAAAAAGADTEGKSPPDRGLDAPQEDRST